MYKLIITKNFTTITKLLSLLKIIVYHIVIDYCLSYCLSAIINH